MAFESSYAAVYDLLYRDKRYDKEAEYIESLIIKYSNKRRQSRVLDLACGTGKHAFLLEKEGFLIDGSDISTEMIKHAREKATQAKSNIEFYNYSFQNAYEIKNKYDVVISMFSAFNYLNTLEDINKTLENVYNLLNKGGIFIFDYWNGNAVIRDYSPVKILRRQNKEGELMRISETSLDLVQQIANVKFTCMYFKEEKKELEFSELHTMRYFYFSELENLLKSKGFNIKFRSAFMNADTVFDPYEWNISIVAEKN